MLMRGLTEIVASFFVYLKKKHYLCIAKLNLRLWKILILQALNQKMLIPIMVGFTERCFVASS